MSLWFAFSDECGNYRTNRNANFHKVHPYYLRATYKIHASDYKALSANFRILKDSFGLPHDKEIKWAYMWELKNCRDKELPLPPNKPSYFLRDFELSRLLQFCDASVGLLSAIPDVNVILTLSDNFICPAINECDFHKMHLQEAMQRIEMDLQGDESHLAVLFFDPVSVARNKELRSAYHTLFVNGDFIRNYGHIKDSLNFEDSQHSAGVQIADYVAGVSVGFFKGYEASRQIFNRHVRPLLRRNWNNQIAGYGIREVPRNSVIRSRFVFSLDTFV